MRQRITLSETQLNRVIKESVRSILRENEEYWPGDIDPHVLQTVQQDAIKKQINDCYQSIDDYLDKIRLFAKSGNAHQVMYYAEQIEVCAKLINRFKSEIK